MKNFLTGVRCGAYLACYYAVWLVCCLLGYVVTAWAVFFCDVENAPSRADQNRSIQVWRWPLIWLWSNDEDGLSGPRESTSSSTRRWIEKVADWSWRARTFDWSARRNKVGNERFSFLGCYVQPNTITETHGPMSVTYLNPRRVEWIGTGSGNPNLDYQKDRREWTPEGAPMRRCYWLIARQGNRIALWWIWPADEDSHYRLRLGWKIVPNPPREIDRWAGLALQGGPFKRKD